MSSWTSTWLSKLARKLTTPAGGASALTPALGPSDGLDKFYPDVFPYVEAPALTVGQLPNGETLTYTLIESNNVNLSSPISSTVIGVQTGAGGAGAAAAIFGGRFVHAGGNYLGLKITASASANAAGLTVYLNLSLFTSIPGSGGVPMPG